MTSTTKATEAKQVWYVYGIELDGPTYGALMWDNGKEQNQANWLGPFQTTKRYLNYQDAWNRMQSAYSANRKRLNRYTFGILEGTPITVDDYKINPQKRLEEILGQFAGGPQPWSNHPKVD